MAVLASVCGMALIVVVLWEGFETIILPRRVIRRFRLTRLFYRHTWRPWAKLVTAWVPPRRQETWLSYFGPSSILVLLAIWAGMMIAGFALLQWGTGSAILIRDGRTGLLLDLYLSGTTFFTLGLGDAVPRSTAGHFFVVIESGMGFAFLALVIAYLPALNQSFSRREVNISLLDARAGSPPTASEMFRRHIRDHGMEALQQLLREWERWSAELLEGHLSYPILAYFRSQHDNESWIAALAAILDSCALVMVGPQSPCKRQAELTFAMARHAVVDLSLVFKTRPHQLEQDRLPPGQLLALRALLAASGVKLREGEASAEKLSQLRWMYEPYVDALSHYFHTEVPSWIAAEDRTDNWQASVWERRDGSRRPADHPKRGGDHF
jgi:hypothetical protein